LNTEENRGMVQLAHTIEAVSDVRARVAVVWAGALPYFMNRDAIDLLGKSDRVIAHEDMHRPAPGSGGSGLTYFYPGHLKYDYAYSIGTLRPDIVAQLWKDPETAQPYLADYRRLVRDGQTLYLRNDSSSIRWNQVDRSEAQAHADER